eukprot:6119178-Pleurochrysis_carterae.AAC.1
MRHFPRIRANDAMKTENLRDMGLRVGRNSPRSNGGSNIYRRQRVSSPFHALRACDALSRRGAARGRARSSLAITTPSPARRYATRERTRRPHSRRVVGESIFCGCFGSVYIVTRAPLPNAAFSLPITGPFSIQNVQERDCGKATKPKA